jgi:predicted Zn-dependent protease
VLIAWSNGRAFAPLDGTVDGVGQAVAAEADPNTWAYASGQVVLDQNKLAPAQLGDRTVARAVILHELGHLVGLDHTTDPRQLMYSESQFGVTDYGAGDLHGLAVLGTQACYPNL